MEMSGFGVTQVDDGYTVTTVNYELNELISGAVFQKEETYQTPWYGRIYYKTVVRFMDEDIIIAFTNRIVRFGKLRNKDRFSVLIPKFNISQMKQLLDSEDSPPNAFVNIVVDLPDGRTMVVLVDTARKTTRDISVNGRVIPHFADIDADFSKIPSYHHIEYKTCPKIQAIEDLINISAIL